MSAPTRTALCGVLALITSAVVAAGAASAASVSPERIGVNIGAAPGVPTDLTVGSAAGLGLARVQLIQGTNADKLVASAADAHMRIYPMLGLPAQLSPAAAASAMAQYVTAFAERYGPEGTFWSKNPGLPYVPVQSYEIGNEPNIPLIWVSDNTHLHWSDPSAYAQVYEAARAALHEVDPSGVAVVGGLADGATDAPGLAVDVQSDEEWLAALTAGLVDAVGYHLTPPVSAFRRCGPIRSPCAPGSTRTGCEASQLTSTSLVHAM